MDTPQGKKKPQVLYGSWKDKFPEDVDIEKDLKELRRQWTEDFEEQGSGE